MQPNVSGQTRYLRKEGDPQIGSWTKSGPSRHGAEIPHQILHATEQGLERNGVCMHPKLVNVFVARPLWHFSLGL